MLLITFSYLILYRKTTVFKIPVQNKNRYFLILLYNKHKDKLNYGAIL